MCSPAWSGTFVVERFEISYSSVRVRDQLRVAKPSPEFLPLCSMLLCCLGPPGEVGRRKAGRGWEGGES